MPINEAALGKVRDASMEGKAFASILSDIGGMMELTGAAESHITFDYQHDDVDVEPGDMIPFISIGLRQATIKQVEPIADPVVDPDPVADVPEEEKSNDQSG